MSCQFSIKKFDELSTIDLYYILQAREQIFIIEPNNIYQDIDEIDFDSMHLVAHKEGVLIGYCRIILPTIDGNAEPKKASLKAPIIFDRILLLPEHRGYGLGHQMLNKGITYCRQIYPKRQIKVTTPTLLIPFFAPLGFENIDNTYANLGSANIDLMLEPNKKRQLKTEGGGFTQIIIVIFIILGLLFIAGLLYIMPT